MLVYGGAGALGRSVVSAFAARGWGTVSADYASSAAGPDKEILLDSKAPWGESAKRVAASLKGETVNVVVNAAGGWSGGSVESDAVFDSVDVMISQNLLTAVAASRVASEVLPRDGGLLVLTGAAAVEQGGTGGMIGYGIAKAGVHHMVRNLALEGGGISSGCTVIGVLPNTIDTPGNREGMPDADFEAWTKPSAFADAIVSWAEGNQTSPSAPAELPSLESGALYEFITEKTESGVVDKIVRTK